MTNEFWLTQKARLIDRFGERNFSKEFSLLVAIECNAMPEDAFMSMVTAMIGQRRPNDPPMIANFREGRLAWERRRFETELRGATDAWNGPAKFVGLKNYLAKEWPGCKSLAEAVEVRRLQIQIARADDPDYDPMADAKWMGEFAHKRALKTQASRQGPEGEGIA